MNLESGKNYHHEREQSFRAQGVSFAAPLTVTALLPPSGRHLCCAARTGGRRLPSSQLDGHAGLGGGVEHPELGGASIGLIQALLALQAGNVSGWGSSG